MSTVVRSIEPVSSPTVVIMAGGQGTRMRSRVPKVLHPICGRAMALWPVHAALEAGAGRVVVVGGPDRALADVLPDGVVLAVQERPLGTGDAVRSAADHIDPDAPVIVLSGDVPLITAAAIRALADGHAAGGARATMATAILADPTGYGRVVRDAEGSVARVVETKKPGDASDEELAIAEVNSGLYAFDGGALLEQLGRLSQRQRPGRVLPARRAPGAARRCGPTCSTTRRTCSASTTASTCRRCARSPSGGSSRPTPAPGVGFVSPHTAVVDVDVRIGADTVVEQGCTLSGATTIGEGAAHRAAHHDRRLPAGRRRRRAPVVAGRRARGRRAPPSARSPTCAPAPHLRARAKAGTFVEIKNSDIGEGAKVPHLSYIGDADVGAGHEPRRGARSPPTTTACASTARRSAPTSRRAVDTTFVAPVDGRRRRLHRRRQPSSPRTCPPARSASARSAPDEHRGATRTSRRPAQ